jgi:dTDP-4-dehydrorhamnose reductase
MKILVVGSGGQLARALREVADAHCAQVATLGRPIVDLTEPATISACLARTRFDIVINTAAFTHVDRAEAESDAALALNTEGATAIASACAMQRLPLIHISTDYVFGGDKTTPFAEGDIPAPLNVYGRSKLLGERRVAALCPNHIIVRTSWLHSPFGTNFVKTILRLAESKDEIAVVDDQVGSPTSAFQLADALLRIAAQALHDTRRSRGTARRTRLSSGARKRLWWPTPWIPAGSFGHMDGPPSSRKLWAATGRERRLSLTPDGSMRWARQGSCVFSMPSRES